MKFHFVRNVLRLYCSQASVGHLFFAWKRVATGSIQDTGMYFVHVWKSCGMKMENVRFIWASDFIEENATESSPWLAPSEHQNRHWFSALRFDRQMP